MTPRDYRHGTRVVTPVGWPLSLLALAGVAVFLTTGDPALATAVVGAYIVLGGRGGGRAPTWHVFGWAALLLVLLAVTRVVTGYGISVTFAATVALCAAGAAFTVWPRIGTTPSGER